MPLTAKQAIHAKPGRHSDGGGLYLLVKPSGSKSWVLRVQADFNGLKSERRDFGIGAFTPDPIAADVPLHKRKLLTLNEAREKARIGRQLAKAGINPNEHWRDDSEPVVRTFKEVADEYHKQALKGWKNGKHRDEWLGSLDRYAFPALGDASVVDIDASAVQKVLLPIWLKWPETARRVKQRIGVVLDYAHAKGWRDSEAPMRAVNQLMRGIKQPKGGNFAAMPYKALPAFMAKLGDGDASVGRLALRFLILTASRSGEVRHAPWREFDLEAAEWRIPPEKMKAGKLHIVPLVPEAVAILKYMQGLFPSKPDELVFPGYKGKPMSDMTMAKALRLLDAGGYTVHGFRSTFRDWAAEHGLNNDWAEAALAHSVAGQEGKTVASYRRTTFYEQRRDRLMPAWAAFALGGSNVVSLAAARA